MPALGEVPNYIRSPNPRFDILKLRSSISFSPRKIFNFLREFEFPAVVTSQCPLSSRVPPSLETVNCLRQLCALFFLSHTAQQHCSTYLTLCDMADERIEQFGGAPQLLPQSALPTYNDIARCFFKACETEFSVKGQVKFVENELLLVWAKCSTALPLISRKGINGKIVRFLDKVRPTVHASKRAEKLMNDLNAMAPKLFDISACTCQLANAPCRDPRVGCRAVNCRQPHIVCVCPEEKRVPVEERLFLRDQRSKVGTFGGAMQMSGPDRIFNAQNR